MVQAVALMCVFGLGMCFSLLGSISVKLMPRLNIDQGKFGTLISIFMFTCLIASLIMGVIVDSIGYKPVAIFGFVVTAICIFVFAQGKTFTTVAVPCLLLGFGAMALNTVGNTLIPQVLFRGENVAAALNMGNVFFGLGLFITPLIVSFLFRKTTYEIAISVLAVIVFLPVILALFARYPEIPAGFAIGDAFGLLIQPVVLIAALALFCYMSLEVSFCNWLPSYGKEVFSRDFPSMSAEATDASAQQVLSIFAIAMMAGRLLASQIAMITDYGSWFIAGAGLLMGLIILGMMKSSALWTSALAVCAGVAFAPVFPTVVGVTFDKHPIHTGSVFGIIFAVGLFGGVVVPKAMGNLSKGSSIQKSLKLLVPLCVGLLVLALILGQIEGIAVE